MKQLITGLMFLSSVISCIPLVKEDSSGSTPTPTNQAVAWQTLSVAAPELLVKSIHSTTTEMDILTNNQLFRLDANLKLIEKRPLLADRQIYGTPICADNTFLRITQGSNNMQVVEFHLIKNPATVKKFFTSELVDLTKNESFLIDVFARTPGVFSTDGTQFFMPGVVYPAYKPTVLIFDIGLNSSKTDFTTLKLAKRIEVQNLSTDGKIESCRFLKGNFYLATKDGGFRITPDGQVKKLFNTWTLDFFEKDDKLYANGTDFNTNDFYSSSDNGLTWKKVGIPGLLRYVETASGQLFHQKSRNLPYDVVDASLAKIKQIVYVNNFLEKSDNYYSIAFFQNQYFISVGNQIYAIKEIKTK